MQRKIGILGGTFNPIHYGHLVIAENACQQFQLDKVIFLPTGHAPHKEFMGPEMSIHRCQMVKRAILENPRFDLSFYEIERQEVNYTCKTLQYFKEQHPDDQLFFILGADSLFDFEKWYRPADICKNAVILVAVRDSMNEEKVDQQILHLKEVFDGDFRRLKSPNISVSSRELRNRAKAGETLRYLVPDQVREYILEHKLYQGE